MLAMVWYGTAWYGMVWYGMVWYGMAWHIRCHAMLCYTMPCYGTWENAICFDHGTTSSRREIWARWLPLRSAAAR